ncbi:50S ribosomal protein L16 [Candidatus Termititenax spirochaetophilus]|uniref:Large ribosomal subunit protein uL16 n=1 Tax=Candidatus Termititenax spirochaetophilus TaxID=2218522 RepID=A0A388T6W6_9BACT|nr:50S ribosomal protein L16 [Candidatus Termititenax spirochaetophilus]
MLMPKRTKYRKQHRGKNRGVASRGNKVSFGQFGLMAMENCALTSRQIEAARKAVTRHVLKGGKIWIRVFPDHVVTQRPADSRMGKGKGAPSYWIAKVRAGKVLFEVTGLAEDTAQKAMASAGHKLPCKVKFVAAE